MPVDDAGALEPEPGQPAHLAPLQLEDREPVVAIGRQRLPDAVAEPEARVEAPEVLEAGHERRLELADVVDGQSRA